MGSLGLTPPPPMTRAGDELMAEEYEDTSESEPEGLEAEDLEVV